MADPLLEAFAITLDPERFPDPQMALSAERRAAVGAALQRQLDLLGLVPRQIPTRPGPRVGCLVRAALDLLEGPDKGAGQRD